MADFLICYPYRHFQFILYHSLICFWYNNLTTGSWIVEDHTRQEFWIGFDGVLRKCDDLDGEDLKCAGSVNPVFPDFYNLCVKYFLSDFFRLVHNDF